MPESQKQAGNSQLLCVEFDDFKFEIVERVQAIATTIRFPILNKSIKMGDVLLVLDGSEIRFHGMIDSIDDKGWGSAADRGSSLPAGPR
jgi:hypothetical protein